MFEHGSDDAAAREDGAAAVEFALVAVLLITLLFGIIQYSFLFWESQTASRVAREVGRQAAVGAKNCADMQTMAASYVPAKAASAVIVTLDYPNPAVVGSNVTATVTFPFTKLGFPFVPVPGGNDASETAVVRLENVTANSTVDCP